MYVLCSCLCAPRCRRKRSTRAPRCRRKRSTRASTCGLAVAAPIPIPIPIHTPIPSPFSSPSATPSPPSRERVLLYVSVGGIEAGGVGKEMGLEMGVGMGIGAAKPRPRVLRLRRNPGTRVLRGFSANGARVLQDFEQMLIVATSNRRTYKLQE